MNPPIIPRIRFALILAGIVIAVSPTTAQITPDQQADMLLNAARKAYNEKNYAFATTKFREFLGKFAAHKDAPAARYGLALTLIDGPEKKYDEARDIMTSLAAVKDFSERAMATYYAGVAHRGLGLNDLALADAKPAEAAKYGDSALGHFGNALPLFSSAVTALLARLDNPADGDKLTVDAEWIARARCDLAEMQIRVGKFKEAQASAAPFVADPLWTKSRYKNLGRYYQG